ncbi:MAG TPA: hypothetical protein VF424_02540, partial [Vicinamibacterales bacterium]
AGAEADLDARDGPPGVLRHGWNRREGKNHRENDWTMGPSIPGGAREPTSRGPRPALNARDPGDSGHAFK